MPITSRSLFWEEYILALEHDDDPSSKNGEGECQCKAIGNGFIGTRLSCSGSCQRILIIEKLNEGKSELNHTAAKVAGRKTIIK